ncbi:helix-turn-helix domain-containing protein [Mechercharimyces sp. CAU 1602]|uniref:helix-turn-helix domain-containing protein n=1 Tax=Mechercharimyces sp. CAU 1602 TaxID=2973933 RepID=UPI0021622180|nr:helix-turn-helix domain-containing protein [Mechercharimyces sp. CAU 1602]MCS1350341.1 helix-turn-helix domain-containing protein [Mechercharimyces sp. CAU 1602]
MENEVFVKMKISATHDGMIGDMGAERWQTLCVLASYIDKNGKCFPSQDLIAVRLGVSRQSANKRIKTLCDYRWQGEPLVEKYQMRTEGQRFTNTVYFFTEMNPFSIFSKESADEEPCQVEALSL